MKRFAAVLAVVALSACSQEAAPRRGVSEVAALVGDAFLVDGTVGIVPAPEPNHGAISHVIIRHAGRILKDGTGEPDTKLELIAFDGHTWEIKVYRQGEEPIVKVVTTEMLAQLVERSE